MDSRNATPQALRKVVFAGGTNKSFAVAAKSLEALAEWTMKPARVAEWTTQVAAEIQAEQAARVEHFHQQEANRSLTQPQPTSPEAPENLPRAGVVEMDGGRIRCRDENGPRGATDPHWREFHAGCVVRLHSEQSAEDPRPEVPSLFLNQPKTQKLVRQLHRQRQASEKDMEEPGIGDLLAEERLIENVPTDVEPPWRGKSRKKRRGPKRLMRTCVATQEGADACGRRLAEETHRRGLDQAAVKGFLADGQSSNWKAWERYFKRLGFVAIADFIHLLSYVYATAMSVGRTSDEGWSLHVAWITALWEGRGSEVLATWERLAREQGIPLKEALPEDDPRRALQRGLTYLRNNRDRVDYPRYRRLGLPVTSTLMESLVKEFNHRVKGTEKFWNDPSGAESILTVRASLLSEDERFDRHFESRPGCRYRRRSTLARESPALPACAS